MTFDDGRLILGRDELARLVAAAHQARPREACGLLGGRVDRGAVRLRIYPAENAARSSSTFRIRASQIAALERQMVADGWSPCGCYHSHPRSAARPSPGDRSATKPAGTWWLIYSPPLRSLRAFRWDGTQFLARPIRAVP